MLKSGGALKSEQPYFATVDLLRAFAAISVLVYHVIECNKWEDFPESFGLVWFKWGWMGVDIFFVISGFVITLSALGLRDRYPDSNRKVFVAFMQRRLRRLVPLHYLLLAIFVLFSAVVTRPDFLENLAAHLFFIHNLFPTFHRAINPPNWSLGVEMQFYLALILIIPFISPGKLKYVAPAAFLVAFVWRAIWFYSVDHQDPAFPESLFMAATQLPGMLDFFAVGMLIAFFSRSEWFGQFSGSWLYRLGLFFALCAGGAFSVHLYTSNYWDYWHTPHMVIFFRSCLALVFGCLVLMVISFRPGDRTRKLLAPLFYLGVISYGIYLFHWLVLRAIQNWEIPNAARLIIVLAGSVCLAACSWHFYERRFLRR